MSPDEKHHKRNGSRMNTSSSSQQTLPLSHAPMKAQYGQHYENGGYANGHSNRYGNGESNYYQQQHRDMARSNYADRTYSLPRTVAGASGQQAQQRHAYSQQPYNDGYYTQDRRRNNHSRQQYATPEEAAMASIDKPDFYFMPSQRKYSGEVVRVYVDYNKDLKK